MSAEAKGALRLLLSVLFTVVMVWAASWVWAQRYNDDQRAACENSGRKSLVAARKAAADAVRERALASAPGEPSRGEHAQSATEAERSALTVANLSGYRVADLDDVLALVPDGRRELREARAFCVGQFPDPGPLPF